MAACLRDQLLYRPAALTPRKNPRHSTDSSLLPPTRSVSRYQPINLPLSRFQIRNQTETSISPTSRLAFEGYRRSASV